jgi:hypothetical protein
MRVFVSIFMVLALIVSMGMPIASHAMMSHDSVNAEHAQASEKQDCHQHTNAQPSEKHTQNDTGSTRGCCDKGSCKCVGNHCHSLSKYFGDGYASPNPIALKSEAFAFDDQLVESVLADRLKRPPKA